MIDFAEACEVLKNAVPMTRVPDYEIESVDGFNDPFTLHDKIKFTFYDKVIAKGEKKVALPNCIGCCQIDNYNGNEILRVFSDIMNRKSLDFKVGNYVCFSVNGTLQAAAVCRKWEVAGITPMPLGARKVPKYRFVFSKLFDDDKVVKNRDEANQYSMFYSSEVVQKLREDAKSYFPEFLKQKMKDSLSQLPGTDEYQPFITYSFIGLMISVAFKSSPKEQISETNPEYSSIPFPACIKFAFDTKLSGKIKKLLGEIEYQGHMSRDAVCQKQAACALEASKHLISEVIPPNEQGLWEEETVQKIAREVEILYTMDD